MGRKGRRVQMLVAEEAVAPIFIGKVKGSHKGGTSVWGVGGGTIR